MQKNESQSPDLIKTKVDQIKKDPKYKEEIILEEFTGNHIRELL
jgi:hypothetical protein